LIVKNKNQTPYPVGVPGYGSSEIDQELAARVFESASDGMVILNHDFKVITANPSYTKITGYPVIDIIGKTSPVIAFLCKTTKKSVLKNALDKAGTWSGELRFIKPDGQLIYLRIGITQVLDKVANTVFHIGIFNDITKSKDSQHQIEYLATHDPLTGLANRNLLAAHLDQNIEISKRENKKFMVMFMDLDNFKIINDSLGHHIGDIVLQTISKRIKETLRNSDLIARIGGDEFAIILNDAPASKLKILAEKLIEKVGMPIDLENGTVTVTLSIGVSSYPEGGSSSADLLKNADIAMYHSKDSGKNTYTFFNSEMTKIADERLSLERDIRLAIRHSYFEMVYQPYINVATSELTGVEALIRFNHPERGVIFPNEFIPFAESVGLIDEISIWVFDEVFKKINEWLLSGIAMPRVSINLSPKNFKHTNVRTFVEDLNTKYPLVKSYFGIEFTETALMEDLVTATRALKTFKSFGAQISLDDFGTGYSSFIHLKKYPIDFIKIDRSFIDELIDGKEDWEITKAIITISHSLGLQCVAEGVETREQLKMLKNMGCDMAQGYLIAKPMKADVLVEWVKSYKIQES